MRCFSYLACVALRRVSISNSEQLAQRAGKRAETPSQTINMIRRLISLSSPSSVLGGVKFAGLLGLATVLPALAEIKINENLGISGFTAGSYQCSSLKGAPSSDSFDVDAAKQNFNAKFDKVTSTIGFYYTPTSSGSNNVTDDLVRPEISYIKYRNNGPLTSETFYALQAVLKL